MSNATDHLAIGPSRKTADSFDSEDSRLELRSRGGADKMQRSFAALRMTAAEGGSLENLDVEDAVGAGRGLGHEELHGDVVDGDAGDGCAFEASVVGVAVEDEIGAVAIDDFGET